MPSFQHINPNAFAELSSQGEVQVVDIRDGNSFGAGHIPGATNLDNSNLKQFIDSADLNAPLVVCCYHGNSSQSAAAFLSEQGFSDVYSLDGGFSGWQAYYPDKVER